MDERTEFFCDKMSTPLGTAILIGDQSGALRMFFWEEQAKTWHDAFQHRHALADLTPRRDPFGHATALTRYFEGDIAALGGIDVVYAGTPFREKVWNALRTIEAGTTLSYGELARRIHEPKAVRAVGVANASNPIAIVVPCHRVIGSDGTLTGYGGGLRRKRWLLDHEFRHSPWRLERSA